MNISNSDFNPRGYTFAILIAGLMLCVLLLKAGPVPYKNEEVYLLALMKHWQPDFLLHDWMYENVIGTHFVFNSLFGWLSLYMPLEYVGWLGAPFHLAHPPVCLAAHWPVISNSQRHGGGIDFSVAALRSIPRRL